MTGLIKQCARDCATGPPGASCVQDTECEAGLSCIGFAVFNAGACSEPNKACSRSCTTDADCASLSSAHWACFANCSGGKFCGQTL